MKKIVIIMISAILFFGGCKKENILSSNNSDIKSTNMKMNYYGRILEYTVNYSPSTNKVTVEGKDAKEVELISLKYQNSVSLFETKNEVRFFNDKLDYYYYIFTQLSEKNDYYRLTKSKNNIIMSPTQSTDITFYLNTYESVPLFTSNINTWNTPVQIFMLRQPCNDGTNNSCPTYSVPRTGIKNPWVGSSSNDEISSLRVKNQYLVPDWGGHVTVTLFQDIDFGGKAIAFYFSAFSTTFNQNVDNLKDYKINTLLKNWNDRTSSYECFYSF